MKPPSFLIDRSMLCQGDMPKVKKCRASTVLAIALDYIMVPFHYDQEFPESEILPLQGDFLVYSPVSDGS